MNENYKKKSLLFRKRKTDEIDFISRHFFYVSIL